MHASYQHLNISELKPGMVLSDVILDTQGQVLLPEATVLTSAMIASLPRHGVEMVAIALDMNTVLAQAEEAARLLRTERVNQLFRHYNPDNDRDWATGVLRQYIEDYRLNREIDA
jgi:hypothetical protein